MKTIIPNKIEVEEKEKPKSRIQIFQEAFSAVMQVLSQHAITISDMYVIGQRLQHQAFEQGMINAQSYVDKKIKEVTHDTSNIQSVGTPEQSGKSSNNSNTEE